MLYAYDNYVTYDDKIKVLIHNHTECECDCKYRADDDCKKINSNYIKSLNTCDCICATVKNCSAYHEFDRNTCECVCKKKLYSKIEAICKSKLLKWNNIMCM